MAERRRRSCRASSWNAAATPTNDLHAWLGSQAPSASPCPIAGTAAAVMGSGGLREHATAGKRFSRQVGAQATSHADAKGGYSQGAPRSGVQRTDTGVCVGCS